MDSTYWHRQANDPLFPDLEWNKPERRDQAGKVLIIGGDVHNLGAPATSFATLKQNGIGNIKIALPDKTNRLVGKSLPEALFLPSTSSGEFSTEGEIELLDQAIWADTILLPGDNGRNSQTAILFQDIVQAYKDQMVITRDALDLFSNNPGSLFDRSNTTIVASFAQLQKLVKNYGVPSALVFKMDLVKLVSFLYEFSLKVEAAVLTLHHDQLIAAYKGKVSTTKLQVASEPQHWRLMAASLVACYQTWNRTKPFESLTHSAYLLK